MSRYPKGTTAKRLVRIVRRQNYQRQVDMKRNHRVNNISFRFSDKAKRED